MLAKKNSLIDEVRPLIIQIMDRTHFRIAPSVLNRALVNLNELPI